MAEIIALDFGTKRIGVARASSDAKIPEPLEEVLVDGKEFEVISSLADQLSTTVIVVGLPRNSKGEETAESFRIKNVAEKMKAYISDRTEIVYQDESATSIAADQIMNDRELPYGVESRDSVAAAVILKEYLESNE